MRSRRGSQHRDRIVTFQGSRTGREEEGHTLEGGDTGKDSTLPSTAQTLLTDRTQELGRRVRRVGHSHRHWDKWGCSLNVYVLHPCKDIAAV